MDVVIIKRYHSLFIYLTSEIPFKPTLFARFIRTRLFNVPGEIIHRLSQKIAIDRGKCLSRERLLMERRAIIRRFSQKITGNRG